MEESPIYEYIECNDRDFLTGFFYNPKISNTEANKIYKWRANENTDRFKKTVESCLEGHGILWTMRDIEDLNYSKNVPNSVVLNGKTPVEKRVEIINAWKNKEFNTLITKGQMSGFGLNLQEAEIHVDSGYNFSFEEQYQKYRRSHRNGRSGRLRVLKPRIEAEKALTDVFEKKERTFNDDVKRLQELLFKYINKREKYAT